MKNPLNTEAKKYTGWNYHNMETQTQKFHEMDSKSSEETENIHILQISELKVEINALFPLKEGNVQLVLLQGKLNLNSGGSTSRNCCCSRGAVQPEHSLFKTTREEGSRDPPENKWLNEYLHSPALQKPSVFTLAKSSRKLQQKISFLYLPQYQESGQRRGDAGQKPSLKVDSMG